MNEHLGKLFPQIAAWLEPSTLLGFRQCHLLSETPFCLKL